MKIFIAGSMSFAKEMLEAQKQLKKMGFEAEVPHDTEECAKDPGLKLNEDLEHCEATNVMEECIKLMKGCDAVLFLNREKDGVQGYIGANSLIELGIAWYLKQKIFLLNPPPAPEKARYHTEVMLMKPTILDGDLAKICEG